MGWLYWVYAVSLSAIVFALPIGFGAYLVQRGGMGSQDAAVGSVLVLLGPALGVLTVLAFVYGAVRRWWRRRARLLAARKAAQAEASDRQAEANKSPGPAPSGRPVGRPNGPAGRPRSGAFPTPPERPASGPRARGGS